MFGRSGILQQRKHETRLFKTVVGQMSVRHISEAHQSGIAMTRMHPRIATNGLVRSNCLHYVRWYP